MAGQRGRFAFYYGTSPVPVANILTVSFPELGTKDIPATDMDSTHEEFIPALPGSGEVTVESKYTHSNYHTLAAEVGEVQALTCTDLIASKSATGTGYLKSLKSAQMDNESLAKLISVWKISGDWTVAS